jgi:phosphoadenosine phosphosulfate reductase
VTYRGFLLRNEPRVTTGAFLLSGRCSLRLQETEKNMIWTEAELQRVNEKFERESPQSILEWAAEMMGEKLAVVTSFQPTGIVTLHMMHDIAPNTAVLTLDTGVLFPETYALIDTLTDKWNLNLTRVRSDLSLSQQDEQYGAKLWERDPDKCCHIRKVVPLAPALAPYEGWITGLRRDQSGRSNVPVVSLDKKYQKVKICPFASWTEDMMWMYIHAYELPYNALHDQNYPSIGCNTPNCTQPVTAGADGRSGRWANTGKKECGLHVDEPIAVAS